MSDHFLVIGAQRCGTTYLRGLLAEHPGIAMAEPARPEPKVFLDDRVVERGVRWYDDTFFAHASPGQLLGEKSTSYLEDPAAAARAHAVLGEHRALVQLRDPVARAVSNWAFSTQHGREDRPLDEVLSRNLDGPLPWDRAESSVSPYAYVERGHYVDHLRPWLTAYGDRLRVQLLGDPIEDTYAWLSVDPAYRPDGLGMPVNASGARTPSLGSELSRRLREHYRPWDEALAQLLGRELPWR